MPLLVFLIFSVGLLAATAAATTGRRGHVCDRALGYTVPAVVAADPDLTRRANELVARWCTAAAVLAAVPLVGLALYGIRRDDLPLWVLVLLAVHGFLFACAAGYPFERIEQLGGEARRPAP